MTLAFKNIRSGTLSLLGIVSGKAVFTGPRIAALILSRRCNSKCVMCWYHSPLLGNEVDETESDPIELMDYDLCEKILRQLRALGTYRIIMGGHGEPTLHPQFDRLLDLLIDLRMSPYAISNGLTLDRSRAASWAKKKASFRFSMHAGDVETWLRIHPECTAAQFDAVARGIKRMADSGVANVATMHAIQRANFRHMRAMIEHARDLGVHDVQFFPVRTDDHLPQVILETDEEREVLRELRWCDRYAKKHRIATNIEAYLASNRFIHGGRLRTRQLYGKIPCYIGWTYIEFDIDGRIRPCENAEKTMGHAGADDLRDVWNSAHYRAFRREAIAIPRTDKYVQGCVCEACPMTQFNINIHNLLRLKSYRYDEA